MRGTLQALTILLLQVPSLQAQRPVIEPRTRLLREVPEAPSGLTATGTGPAILQWQPVSDPGVAYVPLRTQDTLVPATPIAAPLAETSYADQQISAGQFYYYQVKAVYPDGREAVSTRVEFSAPPVASAPAPAATQLAQPGAGARAGAMMVVPSSPTTLSAVTPTGAAPPGFTVGGTPLVAQLAWKKAAGVASYTVFRADGPNGRETQRGKTIKGTRYRLQDTVPDPRLTYQYRLVATYGDGTWGEAVAKYVSPPPVNPTGFKATLSATNTVLLEWDPAPGAAQYRVDGTGLSNTGRYVTGTSTTITPVPPGAQSWQISALYPGGFADYEHRPVATTVNRTLPTHAAFLSRPGPGSEAEATAHYQRLYPDGTAAEIRQCGVPACVLSAWGVEENAAQNGLPGQVSYTNRTELGSTRKTACYRAAGKGTGGAIICHSESSKGVSLIIMNSQGARFANFTMRPDEGYGGWTWGGSFELSTSVSFDSEGPKFAPHSCLACHGGRYDPSTGLVQGASLLPIDPGLVDLGANRAAAEEPIRQINSIVRQTYSTPAAAAYIQELYDGKVDVPGATAATEYVPQGWRSQSGLYLQFVKKDCAMCHLAAPANLSFFTAGNFLSNKDLIHAAVCVAHSMPHAEVPYLNFWNSGSGPVFGPGVFAAALGLPGCP
jgi:hypothetical protein